MRPSTIPDPFETLVVLCSLAATVGFSTSARANQPAFHEPASLHHETSATREHPPEMSIRDKNVRRYAVVVGVNQPARAGQEQLQFADDDAVGFYELFRALSRESVLFSILDKDTQRLNPKIATGTKLPSKKQILERINIFFDRMRLDARASIETEFYFVYSGHGHADDHGEGHLALSDGTLSRRELYREILSRSPADVNHVIIDACDAYLFVQSRGNSIATLLDRRAEEFLNRQTLSKFPNTGAILSTASLAETHEWSEIRAGVFSHAVRSALLGGADANDNGRISYQELEAFVQAASAKVTHAKANRSIFVKPPLQDRGRAVVDLNALKQGRKLRLSERVQGRIALANEVGKRYADLHKAPGYALALRLLPGSQYYVRHDDEEFVVPSGTPEVHLAALDQRSPSLRSRGGALSYAYAKGLFAVPFGPQLVQGYALGADIHQRADLAPQKVRSNALNTVAWITLGTAAVAGGLATGSHIFGNKAHDDYQNGRIKDLPALERNVRAWDTRTHVALGAAVSLGLTAGVMFLVDALSE